MFQFHNNANGCVLKIICGRKKRAETDLSNTHCNWLYLLQLSTKLRKDYMQEPWENRFCSLLLFEVRKINRFLEICHRDPRKILRVSRYSILETRASNLDTRFSIASRIEDRVSSQDCQLTFARYCRSE